MHQPDGSAPDEVASIRLRKGIVFSEHKQVRTRKYKLKNTGQKGKTVLIEHPLDGNWHLVTPKEPAEKTATHYRFAVEAEPAKSTELEVVEERITTQQINVADADDGAIRFFLSQRVISPEVHAALERLVDMKATLGRIINQRKQLEQQLKTITDEQQRIRENMMQLDRTSELYKRDVKKFGDQEDAVEKLRAQLEHLPQDESQKRKALEEYLLSLDLK